MHLLNDMSQSLPFTNSHHQIEIQRSRQQDLASQSIRHLNSWNLRCKSQAIEIGILHRQHRLSITTTKRRASMLLWTWLSPTLKPVLLANLQWVIILHRTRVVFQRILETHTVQCMDRFTITQCLQPLSTQSKQTRIRYKGTMLDNQRHFISPKKVLNQMNLIQLILKPTSRLKS